MRIIGNYIIIRIGICTLPEIKIISMSSHATAGVACVAVKSGNENSPLP